MKKNIKIISSIVLILLVLQIIFPVMTNIDLHTSYAVAITDTISGITYSYSNDTNATLTITGSGTITNDWKMSDKLNSYVSTIKEIKINSTKITTIGSFAFSGCTSLKTVTVGTGVTLIGNNAFENCGRLETVTFYGASTCTTIGNYAFNGCIVLTNIINNKTNNTLPKSITTIGNNAFQNCKALSILKCTIDSKCETIGSYAFAGCTNLEIIGLTSSIKKIESYAFKDCVKLSQLSDLGRISNKSYSEKTFSYANANISNTAFIGTAYANMLWEDKTVYSGEWDCSLSENQYSGDKSGQWEAGYLYKNVTIPMDGYLMMSVVTSVTGKDGTDKADNSSCTAKGSVMVYIDIDDIDTVYQNFKDGKYNGPRGTEFTNKPTPTKRYENISADKIVVGELSKGTHDILIVAGTSNRVHTDQHKIRYNVNYLGVYTNGFAINFDANGGTGGPKDVTFVGSQTGNIPSQIPVRPGYIFKGWGASSDWSSNRFSYATTGLAKDGTSSTITGNWDANEYANALGLSSLGGVNWGSTRTVYAQWERVYTITYNGNGNTSGTTNSQQKEEKVDITLRKNGFAKNGYHFTGWNTAQNGQGNTYVEGGSYTTDADVTLYAQWAINTSSLQVNPNGGFWNNKTTTQTFTQNYNTTKNIPLPTRTGYTFTGWSRTGNYGTLSSTTSTATYTFGTTNNVTDTITATWEKNKYSLEVRPNGGTWNGKTDNQPFTIEHQGTKSIALPTRTGYTFTGWTLTGNESTMSSLTTNNATFTMGSENARLTANWKKNKYNLEVRPNGGTWNGKTENQPFTIEYEGTKSIALPTRTGYTFTGWTLTGIGSRMSSLTENNAIFTMGSENAVLTASWKKNEYSLQVKPNEGTWNGKTENQSFTIEYEGTKTIVLPTRTGYTFTGWTLTGNESMMSSLTTNNATFTMGSENATLTANWKKNKYNLEVRPNGGTWNEKTENQPFTIEYEGTKTIALPTRTGYTFTGWTLTGTGSRMSSLTANNATFTMGSENATLTARWRINTSTLQVNPNGGIWKDSTEVRSFTENYSVTMNIPTPTRIGYTFKGWSRTGSHGTLSSTTGTVVYTFGTENSVTDTITATWEKNKYTLEVKPNGGTWNGNENNQKITVDYRGTQVIPVPSRNSYHFTKWVLAGEGSQMSSLTANNAIFTMGSENASLIANWKLITHDITGNMVWNDQNNQYHSRPNTVQVTLHSDEPVTETAQGALATPTTKTVTTENYQFEKLQTKKTKDNTDYQYTVKQNKVLGYETTVNNYSITNTLILPNYTSSVTMNPLHSFENKLLKNGQAQITGIVTANRNNRDKVGAYREEVIFQIDNAIQIEEDSIQISYIDKTGEIKNIIGYTLENNVLKVNFESNKSSHITAGDSLKIQLNGTLKELKQYVSTISYTGYLRDYTTGEDTNINLGTLTRATNDITEGKNIVEKQLPEANIQIKKIDSITEEIVTDAIFTLYEWDGNKYIEKETIQDLDGDGIYTSKVYRWNFNTQGKYKIEETGIPAYYKEANFSMEYTLDQLKEENYTIEVDYNNPSYTIRYEKEPDNLKRRKGIVENEPYKVKAEITKVDKETRNIIEEEAIFTIYEWNKETGVYEEYISYTDGNKVTMARQEDKTYLSSQWLYYTSKNEGKYRIIEAQAPKGYCADYDDNNEKKTYDINILNSMDNNKVVNEGIIKIESAENKGVLENRRVTAKLEVSVVDKETKKHIGQAESTLKGAIYGLYAKEEIYHGDGTSLLYKPNELIMTKQTNEEAKMIFENLECGNYYLKIIKPSKGYLKEETIHEVAIHYQRENIETIEMEKTIEQQVIKQAFELNKQKENKEALEKAGFSIYLIRDLSIVRTAKIVRQTENTYRLNDEIAKMDERLKGKQNEDETYNLVDLIDYYYQRYIGQEENSGTLPGDHEVYYPYNMTGEQYVLDYRNNSQGEEIREIRTNQEGYLKSPELAYGEYIVIETSVPKEQEGIKPFMVKVIENNEKQTKKIGTVIDKDFRAKVKIYKEDQETNQIIRKENTSYVIRRVDNNELMTTKMWDSALEKEIEYGTLENPLKIEEMGYLITPMELKRGDYILEEVKAPEGYTVNGQEGSSENGQIKWERQEKVKFSINCDINYYMNENWEKIMVIKQENKAVVGTIKIHTEGEYLSDVAKEENYQFTYEQRPTANVKYEVYAKEKIYTQDNQGTLLYEKDQFVTALITDETGKAIVENLPLGKYYIIETETIEGFSKKEDTIEVELSYEGQEVPVVFKEISEEKIRQKVEIIIHNKDEETKERRTGGKYELYTKEEIKYFDSTGEEKIIPTNEKIITLITDEERIIEINRKGNVDLPKGEYYLKEIEAPTGYVLQQKELEVEANQEIPEEIIKVEKDFYGMKTKLVIKEINENNEITTGSEFEIQKKETGEVVKKFTTKGEIEQFEQLETNVEYLLIQTKIIPGYVTAKRVNFVIKENGKLWIEGEEQEENVIIIEARKTKLNIDLRDIQTEEYVEGAILQIVQRRGEEEEKITEWTTLKEVQKIEKLPIGEYSIRETKLPENSGYVTIKEVKLKVEDTLEEQEIQIKQDFTKVKIEITDEETKEKIDNLELSIIDEKTNKVVAKIKEDEEDSIKIVEREDAYYIERLPIGEYSIKEKTPEGYKEVEEVPMEVKDTPKLQIVKIENKRLIYDMQVEKRLSSITINGEKKEITTGEIQKIEVPESKIKTEDIKLEYVICVNNVGETKATIGNIFDSIPEGFKLVSTDWKQEGKQAVYHMEKETLEPGKNKEVKIILKWKNNETNFGEKKNTAKLKGSTNPYGYEDKNKENDIGEVTTIFSIKTGMNENKVMMLKIMTLILIAIIVLSSMVGIEIILLKRKK